jgi:rhamnosyltransferase subunit B
MNTGKRIVLTTHGTLGDLHPFIAIALELQRRGHCPVIATSEYHRRKIEAEGIGFHAVRPDIFFAELSASFVSLCCRFFVKRMMTF